MKGDEVIIQRNFFKQIRRILQNVGVKDAEACLGWAFGEDYGSQMISDSHLLWNARHSDLFILYGDDNIIESVKRIGQAYLDSEPEKLKGKMAPL